MQEINKLLFLWNCLGFNIYLKCAITRSVMWSYLFGRAVNTACKSTMICLPEPYNSLSSNNQPFFIDDHSSCSAYICMEAQNESDQATYSSSFPLHRISIFSIKRTSLSSGNLFAWPEQMFDTESLCCSCSVNTEVLALTHFWTACKHASFPLKTIRKGQTALKQSYAF